MFHRQQLQVLSKRMEEPRRFIQVIVGPRQVGKTTLVRQFQESAKMPVHYASADESFAADPVWIEQQWEAARLKWKQSGSPEAILIIDEIQKINHWSQAVKLHWDKDSHEKTPLKVVLLGSARLTIQQGLTESLAGRFELIPLPHWSLPEMEAAFGFTPEQFTWFGGYPGAATLIGDPARWRDYILHSLIETTISKDILMLTRIDKPALLKRLFELGCAYAGQIFSYNKMLGQLNEKGSTVTLAHYLNLLDSAGMLMGLEKFGRSPLVARASSPKFQPLNTALISANFPMSFEQTQADATAWGRLVETAIGAHLVNEGRRHGIAVFYWREGNDEVDFVLEKNGQAIAIEVKSGTHLRVTGMAVFQKNFQPHKVLMVGKSGVPWQDFLRISPEDLF